MYTRNKEFYDIVGKGLAALGYTGNKPLEAWINDMFAENTMRNKRSPKWVSR